MRKYQQVNFLSNVVKYVRPTYDNKEKLAPLIYEKSNVRPISLSKITFYPKGYSLDIFRKKFRD